MNKRKNAKSLKSQKAESRKDGMRDLDGKQASRKTEGRMP